MYSYVNDNLMIYYVFLDNYFDLLVYLYNKDIIYWFNKFDERYLLVIGKRKRTCSKQPRAYYTTNYSYIKDEKYGDF